MEILLPELITDELTKHLPNHYVKCLSGTNKYYFSLLDPLLKRKIADNKIYKTLFRIARNNNPDEIYALLKDINAPCHNTLYCDIWIDREKVALDRYHKLCKDYENSVLDGHYINCICCGKTLTYNKRFQHRGGKKHIENAKKHLKNKNNPLDKLDNKNAALFIKDGVAFYTYKTNIRPFKDIYH